MRIWRSKRMQSRGVRRLLLALHLLSSRCDGIVNTQCTGYEVHAHAPYTQGMVDHRIMIKVPESKCMAFAVHCGGVDSDNIMRRARNASSGAEGPT